MKKNMNKIMIEELKKIRKSPYWIWNRFVTPENLDNIKFELKYSRRRYKVENVYNEEGKLVGHNVYVM